MTIRSTNNFFIVAACLLLSSACGPKAQTAGGPSESDATGQVVATGTFDFRSQEVGLGTRIAQEPYQETFALRLAFDGGSDLHRRMLIDIDDLPASVAGNYSFGDRVDADLNFLAMDPSDSGRRFSIREGQLEIRVSDGRASGSVQGVARETSFTSSEATLEISIDFDGIPIQEPES